MNTDCKFSIVVISFNQAQFLEETILSVINQNHKNKEIILIDGGSTDGSLEIIKKYSSNFTYWVSEPDDGQSDALIKGFSKCTGDLMGWINSDDLLVPDALKIIAIKVQKVENINGVFYGGCYFIDENSKTQDRFKYEPHISFITKTIGPAISQPGTFFGRAVYYSVGGIDKNLRYGMDRDLFCNFMFSSTPFYYTGKYLAKFRRYANQKGHSKVYLKLCDSESRFIEEKYGYNKVTRLRKAIARILLIFLRVFNGYYIHTYSFRLMIRKSFSEYSSEYSD